MHLPPSSVRRTQARAQRRGVAAVEFAVCLPLLATFIFGVIEASNAIYLQQAITSAAYEAANVATSTGKTSADGQSRGTAVLTALGITSYTITISPSVTSATTPGTSVVVTCTAPLASNATVFNYLGNPTLKAVVTMAKL
jgi:Flp pilus assembly protein TadG